VGTPPPAPVIVTPTPNPVYNTFTPTPTFPSSFGDAQLHVTDPATVNLASGGYQLIEFFAYWCGTCRAMAPLMNSLEDQYGDQIKFTYLDIDNPATRPFRDALHFKIEPEYYLLDGQGKVVTQWSGYVSKEEFQAVFDAVLQ
jgi:thioredoxin